MFRIAILGCENSHADNFLRAVIKEKIVDDVTFVGVYSDDFEAAEKLHREYGVPVAESYDAFVGKVDGILITARHGDNHYKYAKPYLDSGIPMFIDKPVTCTEKDAKAFMADLKARQIPISGGSVCALDDAIQSLKQAVGNETYGKVLGGYFRAPVIMDNPYGGFFFYSQHLVQMMTEVLGNYPVSVQAFAKERVIDCLVRYESFDVNISYVSQSNIYYASISCESAVVGKDVKLADGFQKEFQEFHDLLLGKPQKQSYEDFFAPVFILNAIFRSLESGKEEKVNCIV